METRKVRAKVIMLPTKQSNIVKVHEYNSLHLLKGDEHPNNTILNLGIPQHLYFTTDDEIKEGDWYIDDCNLIRQAVTSDKDYWDRRPTYKKIVATTDKSLGLPEPSQAFMEKYVELGGIEEVDIEYESYIKGQCNCQCHDDGTVMLHMVACCHPTIIYQPVKNSNNIITIYSVKDSWSREEMFQLMDNYQNYLIETDRTVKSFEEWFNS